MGIEMNRYKLLFILQRASNSIKAFGFLNTQRGWFVAILMAMFASFAAAVEADEPERWAIVVGIDNYHDLTHLTSSSKDAQQFGEVLKERCGFKNVSLIVDQPKLSRAQAGNRDRIRDQARLDVRCKPLRERLRNFIKTAEQSGVQTLVVYFSGHGCAVLNPNQQQPTDLLLPAIDASESNGQLTNAISKNEIQNLLAQATIPEKLLVLDCCHAAQPDQIPVAGKAVRIGPSQGARSASPGGPGSLIAPSDSLGGNGAVKTPANSNFVVLAGSGFQQVAGEQVFTKYLVEGLSVIGDSAEDTDKSLSIEIDELFRYVQRSMSAAGGQTPSMELISGKRDGIVIARSVVQPDPQRRINVYVASGEGGIVSQANVKLVFFDNDRSEPEVLAAGVTDQNGKAGLDYHFGETRDRNGQFQINVVPQGRQYRSKTTNLSDFVGMPSGSVFKIALMKNRANSSGYEKRTTPRFPARNSVESGRAANLEPTHKEVINSISAYIEKNKQVPDFCSFEKYFSEYHSLMARLKRSDKLKVSGVTVCFPSVSYWKQNDKFRAEALRILTDQGVIDLALIATRRASSFSKIREPSYNEVKKATFGFIERIDADVCGLVDYVNGYKALIDTLDKSEKYEVIPGLTVCFPSKKSWDSKPSFRKKFVQVLRDAFVLTK